jgi:predicted RNA binding protein YcfA (HicA-like mRNA interferase family)
MPPVGPISHRNLVACLRKAGFSGPVGRGKHSIMQRGDVTVFIPNPHSSDYSTGLLLRILKQAKIARDEWEKL